MNDSLKNFERLSGAMSNASFAIEMLTELLAKLNGTLKKLVDKVQEKTKRSRKAPRPVYCKGCRLSEGHKMPIRLREGFSR